MKVITLKGMLLAGLALAGLLVTTACIYPEGGRRGWGGERGHWADRR